MRPEAHRPQHRFFVPEVIQSSAMDCGPASLRSLLEGFGIPVSYGRLREACQTDVDGTSIDTLEEMALRLGLEAEQIMVPTDHVLLAEARALPAIAVVRLPNGNTHFTVIWNQAAGLVQVMDPASGRHWISRRRLLGEMYQHALPVSAEAWREWASSEEAVATLQRRLDALGVSRRVARELIGSALESSRWFPLAGLDAAVRAADALVRSRALRRGGQAERAVRGLFGKAVQRAANDPSSAIPKPYWSVRAGPEEGGEPTVILRGAVLVRVRGKRTAPAPPRVPLDVKPPGPSVFAELLTPRREAASRPGQELLRMLKADGVLAPAGLLAAMFAAATAVVIEALLLRGFLDLAPELGLSGQRLGAATALIVFVLLVFLLELPMYSGELRLGRHLEARLRMAFQKKVPRLGDRYFHSRLTSDMAERNHSLHTLRLLPRLGGKLTRDGFELLLTMAGIIWLDPSTAPLALVSALAALAVPIVTMPLLLERDLRVRSHVGGLSRFYLDALLGLVAVRAHGAERSLRSEHEGLLVEWARSRLSLQRAVVTLEAFQGVLGYGLAGWLLLSHLARGGPMGVILLMAYWVLKLPVLGLEIARSAWQYPSHRNIMLRLLEPLGAPEERVGSASPNLSEADKPSVALTMKDVSVQAMGHLILHGVDVEIEAGSHVAVVGPSGAGKTSLFGVVLGWHRASRGRVLVDGKPLEEQHLVHVRSVTAWVDPAVQLWNKTLLDNLRYGATGRRFPPVAGVIDVAELRDVLEKLPDGLQTFLGEGGGLVSGGEGQRVRLARALLRPDARLVLLDEPFRGLDRRHRARLLTRARSYWREATLLCVTHDVQETQSFDRVLVMEGGTVVEDATPDELARRPSSRYRAMLDSERLLQQLWRDRLWRRWRLVDGTVMEQQEKAG